MGFAYSPNTYDHGRFKSKSVKKADSFGLFYRASADGVEARWESVGAMVGENITVGVVGFGYSLNEVMVDSPSRWISTSQLTGIRRTRLVGNLHHADGT